MKSVRLLLILGVLSWISPAPSHAASWDSNLGAIVDSPVRLPSYGATFVTNSMAYNSFNSNLLFGNINSDGIVSNADLQSLIAYLRVGTGSLLQLPVATPAAITINPNLGDSRQRTNQRRG
jgi:hypothetical protein